ncbi:hypothetical protein [Burkholderia gladioli]|uniref:hypothetical protein n=1 Tax=Burkholderia gladioli TaxID=28095 RepID=UPI0012D33EDC|nr:hypothetical protein [Burkholderia gladioli]
MNAVEASCSGCVGSNVVSGSRTGGALRRPFSIPGSAIAYRKYGAAFMHSHHFGIIDLI